VKPFLALSRSQILQDLWVLWVLGAPKHGYVLDVGAADGVHLSNSWLLERLGWDGLLVEPNPRFAASLASTRGMPLDTRAIARHSGEALAFNVVTDYLELSRLAEGMPVDTHDRRGGRDAVETITVDTVTATDLLKQHNCPDVIDYLSLDIEGAELLFLETLNWSRIRFRCLTIEHNFTPNRVAIHDQLTGQGYVRVWEELSWFDDWYVTADLPDSTPGRAAFSPQRESYEWLSTLLKKRGNMDEANLILDIKAKLFN
jgi:FkbM family methyltransferase